MSTVARKIQAGTAALGLAGAVALAAPPDVAQAQGAWQDGCDFSPLNFCDIAIDILAIPLNMSLLGFADPVTGNATFKTGQLVLSNLPFDLGEAVDDFAIWLMGPDQEVTFGSGGGDPTVTFFLGSYKGLGFTVSPTT